MCYAKMKYLIDEIKKFIIDCNKYQQIFDNNEDTQEIKLMNSNKEIYKQYLVFDVTVEYKKIKNAVDEFLNKLLSFTTDNGVCIMDCYFLRRLLYKNYIFK